MTDLPIRRVVVADHGGDAILVGVDDPETLPTLVLRPGTMQSFGAAVAAVHKLMPAAPLDMVRALVRKHLPDAPRFDELLPVELDSAPAPVPVIPDYPWRGGAFLPSQVWVVLAACIGTLIVSFVLIHQTAKSEWDQYEDFLDTHPTTGAHQHP